MFNTAFIESSAVLLREGLEAILVIAALATYLVRAGAGHRLSALYGGAGLAVLASGVMAWLFEQFNNGMHDDLMEGVVILFAAVLMFYVSGWLFLKQDPRAWQSYLKQHTDKVVDGGTLFAVAALAFLAVFREGAETALFLHTVAKSHGGWGGGVIAGIVAATFGLAAIFYVVTRTTRRLPLRPVFLVTSGFLFLMGLKFVGEAMQEFQERAVVGLHPAPAGDMLQLMGLNPSWEALGLQIVILLIAAASAAVMLRQQQKAMSA